MSAFSMPTPISPPTDVQLREAHHGVLARDAPGEHPRSADLITDEPRAHHVATETQGPAVDRQAGWNGASVHRVRHPLLAALTVPTVIVIILGVEGLIMGVLEIIAGFSGGGIGSFIMGVLYVLVGLLLLGSPIAAALAVPLVFGILLLIQGVAHVVLAFRVRA
jgi:hypothetical protein